MIAIGIDPGTAICGYGIVDLTGNKLKPIHFGAVFTDKDMAPELRLKKIYEEISVLIDTYKPDIMSIEKLFFNRNVTTAIPVGQARGVVLLAAANKNLPILEFTPMQIKLAVGGTGSPAKEQVTDILLEVNIAKEDSKHGFLEEEVLPAVLEIAKFPHLRIRGLMTVAPYTENAEENRIYFRKMKELLVDINSKNIDNISMDSLSMGMSSDYEVAIEEGATMVRVGTGIFGERDYSH